MRILVSVVYIWLLLTVFSPPCEAARGRYEPGDWVSWTSMRHTNVITEYLNTIYVGTEGGIARYSIEYRRWLPPITVSDGLIHRNILSLYIETASGELVYLTPDGEAAYSLYNGRPSEWFIPDDTSSERLQEALRNRQVPENLVPPFRTAYSPDGILTDEYLRQYRVTDSVLDFWDDMWLAVRGFGLGVRSWETGRLQLLPYGLWNDELRAVDRYGDNFWFVGAGAINIHHRDLDSWGRFEAYTTTRLVSDDVYDVAVESTQVWLATAHGLARYDGTGDRWTVYGRIDNLPHESVRCIAADDRTIWVGTEFGVARLDRGTNRARNVSHGSFIERMTRDLAITPDSAVWAATDGGLYVTRDRGETWSRFTADEPILDAPVSVVEADGSVLWCASRLGVIGYDTRNHTARRLPAGIYFRSSSSADQNLEIYSICPGAEGIVWIGTNEGVLRYDVARDYRRFFTVDDGLIDNRVMDIELDEDYIWFVTPGGVTRFYWNDPHRID